MSKWEGGKGAKRRPETDTTYQDNWEKIFGKKKPETKVRKTTPQAKKQDRLFRDIDEKT